jgi:hypothetical protein
MTIDADIQSIEIDGPFEAGARGITHSKASGRVEWLVAAARPGSAVIEIQAPGAVGRLAWTFADAGGRTRITQRASLSGERAPEYATTLGRALEASMPEGMQKLCAAMQAAFQRL